MAFFRRAETVVPRLRVSLTEWKVKKNLLWYSRRSLPAADMPWWLLLLSLLLLLFSLSLRLLSVFISVIVLCAISGEKPRYTPTTSFTLRCFFHFVFPTVTSVLEPRRGYLNKKESHLVWRSIN